MVAHVRRKSLEQIAAVALRDGLYTGERFRRLDVVRGAWSQATWTEMQAYAQVVQPPDISPSASRLLIDAGRTCGGTFVQLCVGFPERCRNGVSPPNLIDDVKASGMSSTFAVVVPDDDVVPCYPGESPETMDPLFEIVGWLDDERVILRRGFETYIVSVPIDGAVTAERVTPQHAPQGLSKVPHVWAGRGPGERFEVTLDAHGIWLVDVEQRRDYLLEWWTRLPFGPAQGAWQGTLSPDGRFLAVWVEGEGLWTAGIARLPR